MTASHGAYCPVRSLAPTPAAREPERRARALYGGGRGALAPAPHWRRNASPGTMVVREATPVVRGDAVDEIQQLDAAASRWTPPTWEEIVRAHSARVFRSLSSYTPGTFEGWLHRITTNLFLDMARRRQRIRFDALPEDVNDRLASTAAGPEQTYAEMNLDPEIQ